MAYDPERVEALARALGALEGLSERRMFGGLCFMLHGNMLCGVHKDGGMCRVGKANEAAALALPGVAPMDFTGRRMGGFVAFGDDVFADEATLDRLLALGLGFVATLPPK